MFDQPEFARFAAAALSFDDLFLANKSVVAADSQGFP